MISNKPKGDCSCVVCTCARAPHTTSATPTSEYLADIKAKPEVGLIGASAKRQSPAFASDGVADVPRDPKPCNDGILPLFCPTGQLTRASSEIRR